MAFPAFTKKVDCKLNVREDKYPRVPRPAVVEVTASCVGPVDEI